ncbi:MAG: SIS domain-containing protein [Chloroflexi bacterium]|nr:SIS domain-containing protein [Chloroflexota bacterium]
MKRFYTKPQKPQSVFPLWMPEVIPSQREESDYVFGAITTYLAQVRRVLQSVPVEAVEQVIWRLEEARWQGQQVFTCGNGGSAATAIHFASDLSKGAMALGKPPIRAEALCDNVSLLTAWANDVSFDEIFIRRMGPWVKAGDVLVAISGSGNSRNVLNAVDKARALGATTIGFTGYDGGQLKNYVDICVLASCDCMEQIEDLHLLLCHLIATCLRNIPLTPDLG